MARKKKEPETVHIYIYAGTGCTLVRLAIRYNLNLPIIRELNPQIKDPCQLLKFRQKVRIQ